MEDPIRYLLVMTASIDPRKDTHSVTRKDPFIRLADYDQALRFWLANPDPELRHILFLENTGHSLDSLRQTVANENKFCKTVEFVSGDWNHFPPEIGYGCGELMMLDAGIAQSKLARRASYIIKVTGRLTFPSLPRLLKRLPADYLFAVDCRRVTRFARNPQMVVITQLMIFQTHFFRQQLNGLAARMISGKFTCIENVFWEILHPFQGRPGAIFRWPVNADPVGHAAHWTKDYRSPRQRLQNAIRATARLVLPGWWL